MVAGASSSDGVWGWGKTPAAAGCRGGAEDLCSCRAFPLAHKDSSPPPNAQLKHCFAGGWVKSSKPIFVFQAGLNQSSLGFMVVLAALSSD